MAEAYFEIEEYIWLDETIQGNVNVAGLVFDNLLEETIEFGREDVLTVYVEQIADGFAIAEAFTPYHQAFVNEALYIYEFFGTPLRVKQSVLNLIMTSPLPPVKIAHVHLDILHGIDVYWEEVSSELQCHSGYVNAVPYYWEWLYDSLAIDMTEPQPLPPITMTLKLLTNDLVNMRHAVEQEYLFNSKCLEVMFAWDRIVWGWGHRVTSPLNNADLIREIIGKLADDYIYFAGQPVPFVKVKHLLDERVFAFDSANVERFYVCQASDTFAMTDGEVSLVSIDTVGEVVEALGMGDAACPQTVSMRLATESLTFADISTLVHEFVIEEGLDMGDVALARWVFNVLIESGCDIADIIA